MQKRWKIPAVAGLMLAASASGHAAEGDLDIFGFMSVGVGVLDDNDVTLDGFGDDGNFKQDSLLALQVSKQVNDRTSVTGQLVSRGSEDFETEAAWAFVSYQATENLNARLGRLRIPFFYYSEFLEVGYAYNWVRLPSDVYNIPFSSYDGVDLTQRFSVGNVDGSVQVLYGRNTDDLDPFGNDEIYETELDNIHGLALNFSSGNWGMRLAGLQTEMNLDSVTNEVYADFIEAGARFQGAQEQGITDVAILGALGNAAGVAQQALNNENLSDFRRIDEGQSTAAGLIRTGAFGSVKEDKFNLDNKRATFYDAAITYDNGTFSFVGEFTAIDYESGLLVDNRAWLATTAVRMGAFTPHLTYSNSRDVLDSGASGDLQETLLLDGEDRSVILGVRYDYDVNTALKLEAEYHDELENRGVEGNDAMLYSIAVDVIF